jgi:hypothetical protein
MSSQKQTQSSSTTDPWAPQAGALTTAFNQAGNALNQTSGVATPTNFVSGFDPSQIAAFQQMLGYSNGNPIPGQEASAGGALTSAGVSGTQGALSGLQAFDPSAANNSNTLIDNAQKYASGFNPDAEVAQAMLPAMQQARDVINPGIDANAAGTGNTNSSRTGIAQGLVARGLSEDALNLGGALRSQNYGTGLTLASNTANANNAARLQALTSGGALSAGAAGQGYGMTSGSINDQGNLFSLAGAGGAGLTAANQATLNNNIAAWQAGQQAPWTPLQNYMSIVGSNNWGNSSQGTSTTTSTPSGFSIAGGLLSGIGGFMSPSFGIGSFLGGGGGGGGG